MMTLNIRANQQVNISHRSTKEKAKTFQAFSEIRNRHPKKLSFSFWGRSRQMGVLS